MTQSKEPSSPATHSGIPGAGKDEIPEPGVGVLGMMVFLASLSILFIAGIVAYLLVRARADVWPPQGITRLPSTLWISTVVLLASSGTLHSAVVSVRSDNQKQLRNRMMLTLLLGISFLITQTVIWIYLFISNSGLGPNLYINTFYFLSGLHGFHVLGGVIFIIVVTHNVFKRKYSSQYYRGLKYLSMYWHFLDITWLVLFTILYLIG